MARPRLPTAIKEMAGTLRKHRINPREPAVAAGRPACPDRLTPGARAIFEAACDAMAVRNTLAEEWRDVIADYAVAVDEANTAATVLATEGDTFIAGGQIRPRPEVAQRRVAARLAHRLRAELGLGPLSAARTSP